MVVVLPYPDSGPAPHPRSKPGADTLSHLVAGLVALLALLPVFLPEDDFWPGLLFLFGLPTVVLGALLGRAAFLGLLILCDQDLASRGLLRPLVLVVAESLGTWVVLGAVFGSFGSDLWLVWPPFPVGIFALTLVLWRTIRTISRRGRPAAP